MSDNALREHLSELLSGGSAHMSVERALCELPASLAAITVPGIANTPWRLLEHIRIAQWDLLEFSRNPDHVSPSFPDGYWPNSETASENDWQESVDSICRDLAAMTELIEDPATDLLARIPHGTGQTILREAILVADHNAYHLGQLVLLRQWLEGAAE